MITFATVEEFARRHLNLSEAERDQTGLLEDATAERLLTFTDDGAPQSSPRFSSGFTNLVKVDFRKKLQTHLLAPWEGSRTVRATSLGFTRTSLTKFLCRYVPTSIR